MKRLNIEITDDIFKRLKIHAIHENVSLRKFVTLILYEELVNKENLKD